MGLVPTLEFIKTNTKLPTLFNFLELPDTKSDVMLLGTNFLSLSNQDGWATLALHRLIKDSGEHVPCTYPISNPTLLLQVFEVERGGP